VPYLPGTAAVLRLQFETLAGLRFSELSLEKLRIYLCAEGLIGDLYELLFNDVLRVTIRSLDAPGVEPVVMRPDEAILPVGFGLDEGLLPYPPQSFLGYRLLTEFFAFPAKFWFMDLAGWARTREREFQKKVEVDIYFKRTNTTLEQGLDVNSFRLGCTPIVNLFEQACSAIGVDQFRFEYRVVPSVEHPLGMEVHTLTRVASADPANPRVYLPFYTFQHQTRTTTFWHASRRPSERPDDRGSEVYLQFVDLEFNPALPADEVIVVDALCTNRDLPAKLQQAGEKLTFDWMMAAPLERVRCVKLPTAPLRLPYRRGLYWRLISHLSLNHLSIADGQLGKDALQELLRLYDYSDPEAGQQLANINKQTIDGLVSVNHRRVVGRQEGTFCRGIEVTLEFDETKYSAYGIYLFAAVLERFFALYASLNSFSQLVVRSRQREGVVKKWPPRAGEVPLL
jgi:type VI secretion system protein ImpG